MLTAVHAGYSLAEDKGASSFGEKWSPDMPAGEGSRSREYGLRTVEKESRGSGGGGEETTTGHCCRSE
ncbi:unnamed protein product [Ectocarpus sp. CCAP 1310/34]|nr:unnamed protein product [Ectocarpus sp. CCAP 1310/34]